MATTLTFEEPGLTAMANTPGLPVPVGAQLSNQFLTSDGVSFSSGAGFVAVVDHDPVETPSPPNVIGGTTAAGTLDYDSLITATFFVPGGGPVGITDFVKVLGDLIPLGTGSATLTAFDIHGNVLGSDTEPDIGPIGTGLTLSLSFAGIHSVQISETNNTIGFDNFQFDTPTGVPVITPTSGVPEPADWALLIAGFGLAGSALRRRERTARA
jgi:hypothetical protein